MKYNMSWYIFYRCNIIMHINNIIYKDSIFTVPYHIYPSFIIEKKNNA